MTVDAGAERREGLIVAIDGPSGSGKSSVSREVARRLGLAYLDTGAMYRALTWSVLEAGLDLSADPDAQRAVADHSVALDLTISTDPSQARVSVAGTDVTTAIREQRISESVSAVATNLGVRSDLVARQQAIMAAAGARNGIVVEGRDITTVVAPDADVRILLTASAQARLARRALEVHGQADEQAVAAVQDVVLRRDADDATVSSFHLPSEGVVELDSSGLDFEETIAAVLAVCVTRAGGVHA